MVTALRRTWGILSSVDGDQATTKPVTQGGNVTRQLIVNGEVLGRHGMAIDPVNPRNGQGNPNFTGVADFEFGYQSIVSNYPNASPGSYTVQGGDTLQSIARSAYGDSGLWYRIAEANGLSSDRDLRVGQTLNIPNKVGGVHNDSQTFEPYDPSRVVGDTTPNLPMPSASGGCGAVGMIIVAIVAVVATVITAGAASVAAGALASAAAGTGATVGGALTAAGLSGVITAGGAVMVGGAVAGSTAAIAAGGAIVGSAVSQMVGMAIGVKDSFSWKQVALSGISAGATAGIAGGLGVLARTTTGATSAILSSAALRVGMANAVTQGIGVATGLQSSFNWKGVAAAAVGGEVGATVGGAVGNVAGSEFGGRLGTGIVSGFAAGVATAAMRGGRIDVQMVAADAFGNALGASLASQSSSAGMSAAGQKLAPAQGNAIGFGSVYGNADAPSYLAGARSPGVFVGLPTVENAAAAGGGVDNAVPGTQVFRQAELARLQQAARNERAAISRGDFEVAPTLNIEINGVGVCSVLTSNDLEVPAGIFAQRYGMATTMMADQSLSIGQRAGALGLATAIAPMMLLEEGGRGMMSIRSDLLSGVQYLDRSSKARTVRESLRNADMAAGHFLAAGLNVVGAGPAVKAATVELRGVYDAVAPRVGEAITTGAQALAPAFDALAGRYPAVFGPRLGIVEGAGVFGSSALTAASEVRLGLQTLNPTTVSFTLARVAADLPWFSERCRTAIEMNLMVPSIQIDRRNTVGTPEKWFIEDLRGRLPGSSGRSLPRRGSRRPGV